MGWPKGKPRKEGNLEVKQEPVAQSISGNSPYGGDVDLEGADRMKIYQDYNQIVNPDAVVSPVEETKTEETVTEEKKEEPKVEEIQEKKPEETVAAPKEAETTEEVAKPKEEIKTVPYGALHEEREKRKEALKALKEAEARQKQLIEDNMKLMEGIRKPEDETEVAYKPDILAIRAENEALKREIESIKMRFQTDDEEKFNQKLNNLIDEVDKAEMEVGRPGFKDIGQHIVRAKIEEIGRQDPDRASSYQNPDGWRMLWKEEFPKVRQAFIEKEKGEITEKKRQAKLEAGLVSTTGKIPQREEVKKEYSYEDYLKERKNIF